MKYLLITMLVCSWTYSSGQSPVGKWVTIDDNTGKKRSVVEITQGSDGKLSGQIVQLFREANEEQNPLCDKCKGVNKNKPVIGLTIMQNMEKDGTNYTDGTILDPESGSVYDCKIWLENGKLKVRGYVMFFYRTQEWIPFSP